MDGVLAAPIGDSTMFKPAARYPADPRAVFVLVLCIVSGLPLLAGAAQPVSLESQMPSWAVMAYGALLMLGASLTLVGMHFKGPGGVVSEQIGSVLVGVATVFYASSLIVLAGWDAFPAAGIIFGWGLACLARWGQLQALMAYARHQQQLADVRREVIQELHELEDMNDGRF